MSTPHLAEPKTGTDVVQLSINTIRTLSIDAVERRIIGMETFGASAPLKELQRKFGFEPDRVVLLAKELLGRC